MNDRDFIQSIRDQCNAHLGGSDAGGGGGGTVVPAVTVKPSPFADLGTHNGRPAETRVEALQPVGVNFTMVKGSTARALKFFASQGGQNWTRCSWAIFDSGGGRVFGEDNIMPAGTLGYGIDEPTLAKLGAGTYTLGVAVDASSGPMLAFQLNQHPY